MQRVELPASPPLCGVRYLKTASLSSINSPLCPKSSSGRGVGMQILAKWKWIHFHTPHSWPGGQPANRACMLVWHRDKCSLEHRLKPPNWYHMGHQPNSDLALCRWVAVELTRYGFLLQLGWGSGFFFKCHIWILSLSSFHWYLPATEPISWSSLISSGQLFISKK